MAAVDAEISRPPSPVSRQLVVEADGRSRPEAQDMVGAQHVVAVDVHAERLVDRGASRVGAPTVLDDDVRAVVTERAGRRAQLQRAVGEDARAEEDLDVPGLEGEATCTLGCRSPGSSLEE